MLMKAQCTTNEGMLGDFLLAANSGRHLMMRMPERDAETDEFAESVAAGLAARPRRFDCRFLYDSEGGRLFESICRQPEYYLTRTESAIMAARAEEICRYTGPVTILELGSGSSGKTGQLLAAHAELHGPTHYVPVDVCENSLRQACRDIPARCPAVRVTCLHGTYEDAFALFGMTSPALTLFLGSTIGNLDEDQADSFWRSVAGGMATGDFFLLGVDLVKDEQILNAAYNDADGVTAAFTRNLFARMNRELDAGLELDKIEHVAGYNPRRERIETRARFTAPQSLKVGPMGQSFSIARNEEILVEISRKFRLPPLLEHLRSHGLIARKTFTDQQQWFGLLLLERI